MAKTKSIRSRLDEIEAQLAGIVADNNPARWQELRRLFAGSDPENRKLLVKAEALAGGMSFGRLLLGRDAGDELMAIVVQIRAALARYCRTARIAVPESRLVLARPIAGECRDAIIPTPGALAGEGGIRFLQVWDVGLDWESDTSVN